MPDEPGQIRREMRLVAPAPDRRFRLFSKFEQRPLPTPLGYLLAGLRLGALSGKMPDMACGVVALPKKTIGGSHAMACCFSQVSAGLPHARAADRIPSGTKRTPALTVERRLMTERTTTWHPKRARENLAAGEELLASAHRVNAAASRLYYALYHAVWGVLERAKKFPKEICGSDRWNHQYLLENPGLILSAGLAVGKTIDKSEIKNLYSRFLTQRVNADYLEASAQEGILRANLATLKSMIERLAA